MPRTKSQELTESAQKVLDFIRARYAAGEPTGLRAVADHVGWRATSPAAGVANSLLTRRLFQRHGHKLIPITTQKGK